MLVPDAFACWKMQYAIERAQCRFEYLAGERYLRCWYPMLQPIGKVSVPLRQHVSGMYVSLAEE
jgi:hypothetical protein